MKTKQNSSDELRWNDKMNMKKKVISAGTLVMDVIPEFYPELEKEKMQEEQYI